MYSQGVMLLANPTRNSRANSWNRIQRNLAEEQQNRNHHKDRNLSAYIHHHVLAFRCHGNDSHIHTSESMSPSKNKKSLTQKSHKQPACTTTRGWKHVYSRKHTLAQAQPHSISYMQHIQRQATEDENTHTHTQRESTRNSTLRSEGMHRNNAGMREEPSLASTVPSPGPGVLGGIRHETKKVHSQQDG